MGLSYTKGTMQHLLLLGRNALRFPLELDPPPPKPERAPLGLLRPEHVDDTGALASIRAPHIPRDFNRFHIFYVKYYHQDVCEISHVIPVSLVRGSGILTRIGSPLVDILPESSAIAIEE